MKYLLSLFVLISFNFAQAVEVGAVIKMLGTTCPNNYLLLNANYSLPKTTYSKLYTQTMDIYGSSGANFNIPNLAGLYIRGSGSQTINGITYSATSIGQKRNDAQQNITGTTWTMNSWGGVTNGGLANGAYARHTHNIGFNAKSGGGDSGAYLKFDASRVARTDSTTHGPDIALIFCVKVK